MINYNLYVTNMSQVAEQEYNATSILYILVHPVFILSVISFDIRRFSQSSQLLVHLNTISSLLDCFHHATFV
jgi:hypothetical protein